MSPLRPVEQAFVFQPTRYPQGEWSPSEIEIEDAWFQSADGTKLHGWFVAHPRPRGVALVCHGNAGNVTMMAESLEILSKRHRLSVMSFDYRGYGRSEGKPSEEGILQDGRAARHWLAERTGTPEAEIILMGQSLGGAVAIDMAASDGARGLVLVSTFTSLPEVGASHVPFLLPRWNMTLRMDSLGKIRNYSGPVLISHGDEDEVIPFSQGEQLYAAAPGPKRFFRDVGSRHNDPRSEAYRQVFEEFLVSLEGPSSAAAHLGFRGTPRN
jgi:fermentation-respiration switch protein FrsA (DUF1100 family)